MFNFSLRRKDKMLLAVLYLLASALALAGTTTLFGDNLTTLDTVVGFGAIVAAIVIVPLALVKPHWANYFACVVIILLVGASLTTDPKGPIPGLLVVISLSGVLIGRGAVMLTTALSALTYLVAVASSGVVQGDFSNVASTVLSIAFVGMLQSIFSTPSLDAAKVAAEKSADDANIAYAKLRVQQELERQVSSQIEIVMHNLTAIAQRQASSATQSLTATTQLTSTIAETAAVAKQIAAAVSVLDVQASTALAAAEESQISVAANTTRVGELRSQMSKIVERTVALNNQVSRIGVVTSTVEHLAAQTHILALNAAIEAAGAGQVGERFANVAEEVKKLARKAQEEATKIHALVSKVQAANGTSVMATEDGAKLADLASANARAASDANIEVITAVSATSTQTSTIAYGATQWLSAAEQTVETTHAVRVSAEDVANGALAIAEQVTNLAALSHQLRALMADASNDTSPTNQKVLHSDKQYKLAAALGEGSAV